MQNLNSTGSGPMIRPQESTTINLQIRTTSGTNPLQNAVSALTSPINLRSAAAIDAQSNTSSPPSPAFRRQDVAQQTPGAYAVPGMGATTQAGQQSWVSSSSTPQTTGANQPGTNGTSNLPVAYRILDTGRANQTVSDDTSNLPIAYIENETYRVEITPESLNSSNIQIAVPDEPRSTRGFAVSPPPSEIARCRCCIIM